jgi:5-methylcytosine-specific restriction endonuclease McrA
MSRALVLNASYEPLCVVPTRRALLLVLQAKAELLAATGRVFHSARIAVDEPSVVRLSYFVRVPHQAHVALNRRAIFVRDGHRCQYCGEQAENIDHVLPRSRGGLHTWDNVVAACRRCNARKRDHLLEETGMRLRRPPLAPRGRAWALAALGAVLPDWEPYLGLQLAASDNGQMGGHLDGHVDGHVDGNRAGHLDGHVDGRVASLAVNDATKALSA